MANFVYIKFFYVYIKKRNDKVNKNRANKNKRCTDVFRAKF